MTLAVEALVKEATNDAADGVKVGGRVVTAIRFADDQAMLGSTIKGLQRLMNKLNQIAEEYGTKKNVHKTKIMRISKSGGNLFKIKVNGQNLEQVRQFKYLRSMITEDMRCQKEVSIRIAMGKEAFNNKKCLLSKSM